MRSRLVFVAIASLVAAPANTQLGVIPPRVEMTIGSRPGTESIRVFNVGDEPSEIRVSVYNWEMDQDNQVRIVPPTEQSLDQWIAINPLSFTIPPGESQTVRFSVRPRVEPEPGEHRAVIFFEEVKPRRMPDDETLVYFRVAVVVYGYAGEIERKGSLDTVRVEGSSVELDLSSVGTAHVRLDGQYAIWPADLYPGADSTERVSEPHDPQAVRPGPVLETGTLPTLPVLAGTRRTIGMSLSETLPPGRYVLDLNGDLSGQPIDLGIPFAILAAEDLVQASDP